MEVSDQSSNIVRYLYDNNQKDIHIDPVLEVQCWPGPLKQPPGTYTIKIHIDHRLSQKLPSSQTWSSEGIFDPTDSTRNTDFIFEPHS